MTIISRPSDMSLLADDTQAVRDVIGHVMHVYHKIASLDFFVFAGKFALFLGCPNPGFMHESYAVSLAETL